MSDETIVLAVPSKGRLMEKTLAVFEEAGLAIAKQGHERGYRGAIDGHDDIEVAFFSASEIAEQLKHGRIHAGVTGEDLIRETMADADDQVEFLAPLGFGHADVVLAVPDYWVDVKRITDFEDVATQFRRHHGRALRVATGYMNLTRRFLAEKGVVGYRIVESVGATEGTPSAGTAEAIVDITSSGATLRANNLKVLDDGVILQSQANLVASRTAKWSDEARQTFDAIAEKLRAAVSTDEDEGEVSPT